MVPTASTTTPITLATGGPTNDTETESANSNELSKGAAAGVGVGAAVGVLLLAVAGLFIYRRWRQNPTGSNTAVTQQHSVYPEELPVPNLTEYYKPQTQAGELHGEPRPPAELHAP